MIKRKDTNTGDKLHQVKIEFVTDTTGRKSKQWFILTIVIGFVLR